MRELNIDWAALHSAFQMNMPEVRCFLSIEDGRVLKLPPGDPTLGTVRADPQRYIAVDAIPSRIQYQWLDEFIKSIEEEDIRARMEAAINGKGAFRRFKDILLTLPDERRRWFEYRDQMMRQRIIEWVREQGVVPVNEAPWTLGEGSSEAAEMAQDAQSRQPISYASHTPGHAVASHTVHTPHTTHTSHTHTHNTRQPSVMTMPPSGNVALRPRETLVNNPHEIEALRDFLIEYFDKRPNPQAPGPLELEEVAGQIAKRFRIKSMHA